MTARTLEPGQQGPRLALVQQLGDDVLVEPPERRRLDGARPRHGAASSGPAGYPAGHLVGLEHPVGPERVQPPQQLTGHAARQLASRHSLEQPPEPVDVLGRVVPSRLGHREGAGDQGADRGGVEHEQHGDGEVEAGTPALPGHDVAHGGEPELVGRLDPGHPGGVPDHPPQVGLLLRRDRHAGLALAGQVGLARAATAERDESPPEVADPHRGEQPHHGGEDPHRLDRQQQRCGDEPDDRRQEQDPPTRDQPACALRRTRHGMPPRRARTPRPDACRDTSHAAALAGAHGRKLCRAVWTGRPGNRCRATSVAA